MTERKVAQKRFEAALQDTEAAEAKAAELEQALREYLRESQRPPR